MVPLAPQLHLVPIHIAVESVTLNPEAELIVFPRDPSPGHDASDKDSVACAEAAQLHLPDPSLRAQQVTVEHSIPAALFHAQPHIPAPHHGLALLCLLY